MTNKIKVLIFIMFLAASASTQNITGSPFSAFGYGIIEDLSTGSAMGMGGASTGLSLPDEINTVNPAAYAAIPRQSFLFNAGLRAKRVEYQDGANLATKFDNGFTGINAAFNISDYWAAGFGLMPYSSIGYNIQTEDSIVFDDVTYNTRTNYYGEGGLNKLYLATALRYEGLSVGADFSYIFGLLGSRTESSVTQGSYSGLLQDIKNINANSLYITYGLQYKHDFSEYRNLTVGLTYNHNTQLNSKQRHTSRTVISTEYNSLSDTIVQDTTRNLRAELPQAYSAGISYKTAKWLITADYSAQMWSNIKIDARNTTSLSDSYKVSGGMQYTPALNPEKYIHAIKYRIGAYYTNSYINIGGNPVEAYALTFGVGLPAQRSRTFINLGFEIGQKGSINETLMQERYIGMNISLNMADIWFVKRKFD